MRFSAWGLRVSRHAALLNLSEKLGVRHDAFSTRDRVARGLVVNLVLIAIAALVTQRELFG
jgi:hypothetical protein